MPRNRKIEEILEAWYDWDRGEPSGRGEAKKRLYQLLDAVRAGTDFEAEAILDHLWDDFPNFCFCIDLEVGNRERRGTRENEFLTANQR